MKRLMKWLMIFISVLLLLIGLLTFPLPIPIGLPIFLFGLVLLARFSYPAKKLLLRLSRRHPLLRQLVNRHRAKGRAYADTAKDRVD